MVRSFKAFGLSERSDYRWHEVLCMLTMVNEYTRKSLAKFANRKVKSDDVLHCLADLFLKLGASELKLVT